MVFVLYPWLSLATTSGNGVLAFILAWVASPIIFPILAFMLEAGRVEDGGRGTSLREVVKNVFDTKIQAKSFVYGDTIILPFAFFIAADKWSQMSFKGELMIGWFIAGWIVGIAAGFGFHFIIDKPGYKKLGHIASLDSPTKLFHDFVTYPVLFGGLFYAFFPLLFATGLNLHTILILAAVAFWGYLGIKVDGGNAKELVPWGHPHYDWKEYGIKKKRVS
ncbi:MAG: hypothetical protein JWM07_163 [Candidatus Saccharibacteria bacterium]|nr:hypothetical protein [Candidatus Saccharibacteria bacterium]